MFFFKNYSENEAEKLIKIRFFFKKKSFVLDKNNWYAA